MSFTSLARCCIKACRRGFADDRYRRAAKHASPPDVKYKEELFSFTRGRFVCNEQHELSQRRVRFDVNELARCAAEAVGAESCIDMLKYPDGMYNKIMLLTMDNGSRVVAQVPNPNAGLPHFTTASEVATMDFARNVLETPVPKVLAWCSQAHETPVGAKYIIMEQTSVSFTNYGSLYYSKDLDNTPDNQPLYVDAKGNRVMSTHYAIGPSTGREFVDNGRVTAGFDRGPWNSLEAYHTAIGHREMTCISQFPELPKSPVTLCGPGTYQPTRARKLEALRHYLNIIRHILPKDENITLSHLWHEDLHVGNIFVDPSEPTKVVGLIDWQSTELSPLYFHARQPHFIDYEGSPINGLERPQPRKDLDKLEPSARREAEALYLYQSLCSLYMTLISRQNPRLYEAIEFQNTPQYEHLLLARNILIDGEVAYLSKLAELESTWSDLSVDNTSICPFTLPDKDRNDLEAEMQGVIRGMEAMRSIRDSLGELFPEQGIVRPEQFDETLDALNQMKEQVISAFASTPEEKEAWERNWPFET
ncbi:hypothetical protein E8E13_005421 [Curvularia kusanoi]|uniref:Aminoglycoside phosphotransferase domain-containing protein n=1 Tax=Curvularia kusanoi TaxID=90978 RepID=A0A9P4TIS0_CURKU|nr:hypothetical protein E8E13_005421 [Curvularia kusanoi]